jgi:hypothetical protein
MRPGSNALTTRFTAAASASRALTIIREPLSARVVIGICDPNKRPVDRDPCSHLQTEKGKTNMKTLMTAGLVLSAVFAGSGKVHA